MQGYSTQANSAPPFDADENTAIASDDSRKALSLAPKQRKSGSSALSAGNTFVFAAPRVVTRKLPCCLLLYCIVILSLIEAFCQEY